MTGYSFIKDGISVVDVNQGKLSLKHFSLNDIERLCRFILVLSAVAVLADLDLQEIIENSINAEQNIEAS